MSEIDDLEAYETPDNGAPRIRDKQRHNRRLSDAEADKIFERVKAELAKSKAKAGGEK